MKITTEPTEHSITMGIGQGFDRRRNQEEAGGCLEYELPGNEAQKWGTRDKEPYIFFTILDDFYKCLNYSFP